MQKIRALLYRLKQSVYLNNIAKLSSGNVMIYFISLISLPITTRIYSPEDYGIMAKYAMILAILSIFVTSHFVHAINIGSRVKDTINIAAAAFVINLCYSVLLVLLLVLVPTRFLESQLYGYTEFAYILPFSVFSLALSTIIENFLVKLGEYSRTVVFRLIISLITVCIVITVGFVKQGPYGLLISSIFGSLVSVIFALTFFFKHHRDKLKLVNTNRIFVVVKREMGVFYYLFPGDIFNTFLKQFPILIIDQYKDPILIGIYDFAKRVTLLPSQLVGSSVLDVLKRSASEELVMYGHSKKSFRNALVMLTAIATPVFFIFVLFAPIVVNTVFPAKWHDSIIIIQIMGILALFQTICNPLSYIYILKRKYKEDLITQVSAAILIVSLLYYLFTKGIDFVPLLVVYSICYSLFFIYMALRAFYMSK